MRFTQYPSINNSSILQSIKSTTASFGVLTIVLPWRLKEVLILSNTVRQGTEFDFDNVNFKYAGDWSQTPVHNQVQHIGPKRWLFYFLVGHKDSNADYLFNAMQPILNSCLYSYNFKHTPGLLRMETHITKILHTYPK